MKISKSIFWGLIFYVEGSSFIVGIIFFNGLPGHIKELSTGNYFATEILIGLLISLAIEAALITFITSSYFADDETEKS